MSFMTDYKNTEETDIMKVQHDTKHCITQNITCQGLHDHKNYAMKHKLGIMTLSLTKDLESRLYQNNCTFSNARIMKTRA